MPSSRQQICSDGRGVLLGDDEGGASPTGSIDEEAHGVVLPEGWQRDDRLGRRRRQGVDAPCHFAGDPELFARGRQDVDRRVLRQERCRECGTRFEEVLAVVEDEQRSFRREGSDQLLDWLQSGDVMGSHRGQRRRSDPDRVGHAARAPRTRRPPGTAREVRHRRRAQDASCPLRPIPST